MLRTLRIYIKNDGAVSFFYYVYEKGDMTYARSFLSIK